MLWPQSISYWCQLHLYHLMTLFLSPSFPFDTGAEPIIHLVTHIHSLSAWVHIFHIVHNIKYFIINQSNKWLYIFYFALSSWHCTYFYWIWVPCINTLESCFWHSDTLLHVMSISILKHFLVCILFIFKPCKFIVFQ